MAPAVNTPFTAKVDGELEGVRAREFYKYYEPFHNLIKTSDVAINSGTDGRVSSFDDALAAFAQLITLRLKARRVILSCFDHQNQYVLAEATPTLCLQSHKARDEKDHLWLGTCIRERHSMLCERTLELAEEKKSKGHDRVVVMADINEDEWFNDQRSRMTTPPSVRFYAGTAIRSPYGPVIGVVSVLDDKPRDSLSDEDQGFLEHMADTIMSHLDMVRSKEEHRRNSQMVIGLGSFVEGKGDMDVELHANTISTSGSIEHQDYPPDRPGGASHVQPEMAHAKSAPYEVDHNDGAKMYASPSFDSLQSQMLSTDVRSAFSRAAHIIKKAIDVEGVVFLDASVGSFGGLEQSVPAHGEDDMRSYFARTEMSAKECPVLGCAGRTLPGFSVSEGFLHSLLKRYAQGRIFNFDPQEDNLNMSNPKTPEEPEDFGQQVEPEEEQHDDDETREQVREQRQKDLADLQRIFPDARSLAFIPLWDDHRMRWFSAGIAWSTRAIRLLHKDSELSFLRAFGITIMSEVAKLDTAMADKAKSDLLNSISHELRSPLHGILGSIECLESSTLNSLQQGLVETVETCGRTLLDTIDHLLDFSKINNFTLTESKRQKNSEINYAGQLSLDSHAHLPTITEEALETVFAGYSFFAVPAAQLTSSRKSLHVQMPRNQNVQVIIDIEAKEYGDWLFSTEGGAWRRLVMNLVSQHMWTDKQFHRSLTRLQTGNSLKYTNNGYVQIKLRAQDLSEDGDDQKRSRITLTVKDTGKGISKEYLQNHLFKPFAQEDPLNPGTGLGLSMVRHIVSNLGGEITVDSEVGQGTQIRVQVIMSDSSPSLDADKEASAVVDLARQLQGMRTVFIGPFDSDDKKSLARDSFEQALCKLCRDWFGMDFKTINDVQDIGDAAMVITTPQRIFEIQEQLVSLRKPVIVLCDSASRTQQTHAECANLRGAVATEFISQPFGPRKMAHALTACIKRQNSGHGPESVVVQRDTELASCPNVPPHAKEVAAEPEPPKTQPPTQADSKPGAEKKGDEKRKRLRVLLVDDNKINLQLLVRYCKAKGHDYVMAEDGVEAVEAFSQHQLEQTSKFDFVCMDISMPRMDGLEATRRIRSFEQANDVAATTVIALTGLASAEAQQEAFSSGIDQFMTKPVRLKRLGEIFNGRSRS